ncbi:MAG: hypothetical protein R3D63_12805 [Paracoccaceae bacterium]
MSIWISRALACLALAACVDTGGGATRPAAVSVLGGAMTVAVPAHYCIDPASVHEDRAGAVAIAGRCGADRPVPPAAITVSLGGEGSAEVLKSGARVLTDWARSPAGRAALSRDGNARTVSIRQTLVSDGAFLIQLDDRRVGSYWRAAIPVQGRLVLIAVAPPEDGTLSVEDGRRIVEKAVTAMRRANGS